MQLREFEIGILPPELVAREVSQWLPPVSQGLPYSHCCASRAVVAQCGSASPHLCSSSPSPPALQLGVTAAVAIGVSVLSHTARALPIKSTATVAKGLWLLGGAFVLFRLGAGALAHVALMLDRNARRKRRLIKKLEVGTSVNAALLSFLLFLYLSCLFLLGGVRAEVCPAILMQSRAQGRAPSGPSSHTFKS